MTVKKKVTARKVTKKATAKAPVQVAKATVKPKEEAVLLTPPAVKVEAKVSKEDAAIAELAKLKKEIKADKLQRKLEKARKQSKKIKKKAKKARRVGARKGRTSRKQVLAERRKIRGDLGEDRNVMMMPEVPGFVLRWANDEMKGGMNRVHALQKIGYVPYDGEHVEVSPPDGFADANISMGDGAMMAVGTTKDGKQQHAVLMMIPEEFYWADQAIKQEAILKQEESIFGEVDPRDNGMYGGIRVTV